MNNLSDVSEFYHPTSDIIPGFVGFPDIRVDHMDRLAVCIGVDLVKYIGELQVKFIFGDIADMRHCQHIRMVQQRMVVSLKGSTSKTSTAAKPGLPVSMAVSRAFFSTRPERDVFTNKASGRIRARSSAVISPCVSGSAGHAHR